jgi:hypothetical protein
LEQFSGISLPPQPSRITGEKEKALSKIILGRDTTTYFKTHLLVILSGANNLNVFIAFAINSFPLEVLKSP